MTPWQRVRCAMGLHPRNQMIIVWSQGYVSSELSEEGESWCHRCERLWYWQVVVDEVR